MKIRVNLFARSLFFTALPLLSIGFLIWTDFYLGAKIDECVVTQNSVGQSISLSRKASIAANSLFAEIYFAPLKLERVNASALNAKLVRLRSLLTELSEGIKSEPNGTVIAGIQQSTKPFEELLYALSTGSFSAAAGQSANQVRDRSAASAIQEFASKMLAVVDSESDRAFNANNKLRNAMELLVGLSAIVASVGVLSSAICMLSYNAKITKPLLRLQENSVLMSEMKPLKPSTGSDDEIGDLERALSYANRELRSMLEREAMAIEWTTALVMTLTPNGTIKSVNQASRFFLNIEPEAMVSKSIFNFVHQNDIASVDLLLANILTAADQGVIHINLIGTEGRTVETALTSFWSESRKCLICVASDITEQRRAERLKTESRNIISQKVQSPLNEMSESLVAGLALADKNGLAAKSDFDNCLSRVRYMQAFARQLDELQQLELPGRKKTARAVSLQEALDLAIAIVQPLASEKGVVINCQKLAFKVNGPLTNLVQVFSNLLSNAIRFSPSGGKVEIKVKGSQSECVRIFIEDQGQSIEYSQIDKIFEPFVQATNSIDKNANFGLGLSICKKIVEGLGGQIGVDVKPDGGASFWFDLPVTIEI